MASGVNLLQAISQISPDIVCLDYNLPDTNGLELLKSIASEFPKVAVVMITGEMSSTLRGAAAEAGAAGFVQKPFSHDQVVNEIHSVIHTKHLYARTKKQTSKAESTGRDSQLPVKKTAIIADDSRTMRELLKLIISNLNVEVIAEVTNGTDAVAKAVEHRPDIVCLDIDMPGMHGLDALQEIRQKVTGTKVMMISGNSKREAVMSAVKYGAVGFILKPFDPDKVGEAITKALSV